MHIIVGLGNPGEKYKNTRHNAGFMAVDALADKHGLAWKTNKKVHAWTGEYENKLLAKPWTYMNNSGLAVRSLLSYYDLLPKKWHVFAKQNINLADMLTVIHDDLDLPVGKYKISTDSRSAGHKGIDSIIRHLKTKHFRRIRIGIANDQRPRIPAPKFVLQRFGLKEQNVLQNLFPEMEKELE